ncbi:glycosyltransferase family 4 protein [Polaribacter undariae]|uniref:Glycosyltransferase family 4 protein n=1 Tax=Polaribacter sejongensis TaxID=985043 RepID=A0AAJ1VI12_9FLAO|nr:glycosyltransferase family 4 protein [Polaribacter undariae]MDN3620964.1 glycosyltransferase family 4 protein [Polaribacter undariae]UWD31097.1 glycosyltransferase family 4 protein [Polaribacter undariae]
MKNILFIHQSADLYGSDKTLLYLLESIKDVANVIVVVPEEGPLTEEFKKLNIEVFIIPVIKVSRQLFTNFNVFKLPFQIYKAVSIFKKKLGNRKIDLIHSNTIAVFLGAFYSKIYNIKHIWHVHEIIQHPKMVAKAYPFLVDWFSDCVVFNSVASAEHLYKNKPKLKEKSTIIYNGLDRNVPISSKEEQMLLRNSLFKSIDKSSIVIGLVGRINRHKGQQLLLSVFNELKKNPENNIYLLFVGSTIKSQLFLLEELKDEIKNKNLENFVTIVDFQKEIWKFYDCIDIVLVPTTDIESFGLVAIEGMLSKKPVIASNHGGLKEIVIHNTTGLLFEPNNASDLKKSIESLLINQNLIELYGKEGEKRAKFDFSLEKYVNNFKALYNSF